MTEHGDFKSLFLFLKKGKQDEQPIAHEDSDLVYGHTYI
jgi:hypothetical protein